MLSVKPFVSFVLYLQHEYHDKHSLRQMDATLKEFYVYKAVLWEWKTNKSVNTEVGDILKHLGQERDEEMNEKRQKWLTTDDLEKEKNEWNSYIENKRI